MGTISEQDVLPVRGITTSWPSTTLETPSNQGDVCACLKSSKRGRGEGGDKRVEE